MSRALMIAAAIILATMVMGLINQAGMLSGSIVKLPQSPPPRRSPDEVEQNAGGDQSEEVAGLQKRVVELEAALYEQQQYTTRVESNLRATLEQKAQLEQQYSALQEHSENQAEALAALQAEIERLGEDLVATQGDLRQANARTQELETKLAAVQPELQAAIVRARRLETEVVAAQTELQGAKARLVQLEAKLAAAMTSARRALLWVAALGLPLCGSLGAVSGYLYSRWQVAHRRRPFQAVATRDLWLDKTYRERMVRRARQIERRRRQNVLAIRHSRPVQVGSADERRLVAYPVTD